MKRMKYSTRVLAPLALLGCLTCAAPAVAQVYSYYPPAGPDRPVQWFVEGGGNITTGQIANSFNDGFTIGGGVNVRPYPHQPFLVRFDVDYSYFDATSAYLNAAGVPGSHGYMNTLTGFVDGVLEAPASPYVRFYFMAGIGLGYRAVYLGSGNYYCSPFYYCGCGCGGYSGNSDTNFAWNAGLGVAFPLPGGSSWFIESRYERFETSGSPSEFIPIRVGFRF
jgi:hypothetical protein